MDDFYLKQMWKIIIANDISARNKSTETYEKKLENATAIVTGLIIEPLSTDYCVVKVSDGLINIYYQQGLEIKSIKASR